MKYIVLLLPTLFLTACAAGNLSPAPTPIPSHTPKPTAATETSTSIPPSPSAAPSIAPSETSEPAVPEITAEQMTITFDLTNPNIPKTTEGTFTSGIARQSVLDYLKTAAGGSLLNADGSVDMAKLPPGIRLAKPGQWTITSSGADENIFIKWGGQYGDFNGLGEYPLQPTNLLFQLTDGQGNNIATVTTELLRYQDAQGIAHIEPVFFIIYSDDTAKIGEINKTFGHDSSFMAISTPYLGLKTGQTGPLSPTVLLDRDKLFKDDMQSQREKFAAQLIANQDPKGIGNLLWGVWSVGPF